MNVPFRALLIGVPKYQDESIDDLPFVADDMAELAGVLEAVGYEVVVHSVEETHRDGIDSAVEAFFQDAEPGQTLLLYLSGHGIHHDQVDYLVPAGALLRSHDFRRRCLSLDFGGYVERSRAGDVAVFVDACREGITLREMSGVNAAAWSDMRARRVGDRHYCHVYACSPGERARYTTAGGSTFSLFSRALSTVVAAEDGPRTLRDLKEHLQSAVDALTAEHGSPRQQVRVSTETDLEDFVLFDRPEQAAPQPTGEHPWVPAAREHPAWALVADGPGTAALREAAVAVVERLVCGGEKDERLLEADPWRAPGFAERMTDRVSWLLSKVLNLEKLALSPAETALLVVAPFLYVAYWSRMAARALAVDPTNFFREVRPSEELIGYEQFLESQPRLVRRGRRATDQGDAVGAAGIGWWLFHRWLARKSLARQDDVLGGLLGDGAGAGVLSGPGSADDRLAAEVLRPEGLSALLRALRMAPDLNSVGPVRQVAGSTAVEQHVRDQLLVALLSVAHRLAIEPAMLPDVVVEHLGISYAVELPELHRTLETARWDPRGRTRVLNAACHHPSVSLALHEHVAALDGLLSAIDVQAGGEAQLAPLQDLPAHATADQVHAAPDPAGKPVYEPMVLRFRLADHRIQELLMGEQLYGDPALAIREVYQNALDACRYREARTELLTIRTGHSAHWSGRITFTQGEEDGRAYIECTDNGIGMGERELRELFSQAGMRFADLPEYLEEQADWQAEGIQVYPNSRFGIGVLSYFMIADDITVTTCRLDRDGHPGQRLQVDIAGPGSLFYIRDLGRGYDAGTTVRLYLRPSTTPSATQPSCTGVLRRLLWISDYRVTASDAVTRLEWEPGVLSQAAPLGGGDPHNGRAVRRDGVRVDPTSRAEVWWCGASGAVLADGLWAGKPLFGAVVNLTGRDTPVLTVDRRRMLGHDPDHVVALLRAEIPALMDEGAAVLSHGWVCDLVESQPWLADEIVAQTVAVGRPVWRVGLVDADVAAVGCFSQDTKIIHGEALDSGIRLPGRLPRWPDWLADWRLLAWAKAGRIPGVSVIDPSSVARARPTDELLLAAAAEWPSEVLSGQYARVWLARDEQFELGHALKAGSGIGASTAEVVARLAELGPQLADNVLIPQQVRAEDRWLVSCRLDGEPPWLPVADQVELGHLLGAAVGLGLSASDIGGRLTELGFRVVDVVSPESVCVEDSRLLSRDLSGGWPWLTQDEVGGLGHVLSAAWMLGWSPSQVSARLVELGFRVADVVFPESVRAEDARLLSCRLDGGWPWLEPGEVVGLGHLVKAAQVLDTSPVVLAARLTELGFRSVDVVFSDPIRPDDTRLLSQHLDGAAPWLEAGSPVGAAHVLVAASTLGWTPGEVIKRLLELGAQMVDDLLAAGWLRDEDVRLVTGDNRGIVRRLASGKPLVLRDVLLAAYALQRSPVEVVGRLAELGIPVADIARLPLEVRHDDVAMITGFRVSAVDRPVEIVSVLRAANSLGRSPAEVAARFLELGWDAVEPAGALECVVPADLELLKSGNHELPMWLRASRPVPLSHILSAAQRTGRTPTEVARRLAELGYTLPDTVRFE
ncbi:caspase family protein [Kitasatospora sp. NPDC008050]|uniref:wHTH domain-containing protein n=1 Tax=Kitasatospora sp. NPDC008050 TaxID=3364021 RepID=UPI0036EE6B2F